MKSSDLRVKWTEPPRTLTRFHWINLALQSSVMQRRFMSQRIKNTVSCFWFWMKISPLCLQAVGRSSVSPPTNLIILYFLNFYTFFSWRKITLQCCAGFSLTEGGSVITICVCPHPCRSPQSSRLSSPCSTVASTSCLFHTQSCINVSAPLSVRPTLSSLNCVHKSVLTSASPFLPYK